MRHPVLVGVVALAIEISDLCIHILWEVVLKKVVAGNEVIEGTLETVFDGGDSVAYSKKFGQIRSTVFGREISGEES